MKQIIDGLMFDTESSELLHRDTTPFIREWYKTENGNYFCVYPNMSFARKSEENVKEHLGRVDIDKYIELFGTPQEA